MKRIRPLAFCVVTIAALIGAAPALAAQTIHVTISGTDGLGCGQGANTPCATIQGALDQSPAAHGDTIQVGPGQYSETSTLKIDKDVTIVGAGDNPNTGGTSLVLPSPATGLQPDGAPNPATGSPPDYAVAYLGSAGSGTTITDMTFNGSDDGNPGQTTGGNYPFVGLDIYDASATLDRVQITGIEEYPFGGGIYTTALQANDDNSSPQTLTVEDSNLNAYQKAGTAFWGTGLTVNITNSVVSGVGQTPNLAQNGIQYLNGAAGTVSGDTVTGNECDEPGGTCGPDQATQFQAVGVALSTSGPVTVSHNTINNNDIGIFYGYPTSGTATISNNVMRGDRYEGIDLNQGTANVSGNVISDSNYGVQVYSYGGTGPLEDTGNAVAHLVDNTLTHNKTGIETGDDTPSSPAFYPVVTAHHNDISGNTTSGFANDLLKPQDATYNYWGCEAGPGHKGCDGVTGVGAAQVKTTPFLPSLTALGAPRVSIIAPRHNPSYPFGERVRANYSCQDASGGPGISSCSGTVRNGSRIDTSRAGPHTFTVTATSNDGLFTTKAMQYTVLPDNQFTASHVKAGPGGSVSFEFVVPGSGKLDVLATRSGQRSQTYGQGVLDVRAGHGTFVLRPNATGQTLLRDHPQGLSIVLHITYQPTGGRPRTKTRPRHYGVHVLK